MKIVKWNEEVETPILSDTDGKKVFLAMLKRTINEPWKGKIRRVDVGRHRPPYAELRKDLGGANVLVSIGRRKATYTFSGHVDVAATDYPIIKMSMNGTASFTMDDFMEINLAVIEAEGVIKAMIDNDTE